uniref:Venom mucin n=1 Tax=Lethocerus distinctifemur TaxID=280095 RepID=A0A2K8JR96_9HEMI|nr:venom mucin [Lethocerus distinctifemur]
MNGTMIGMLATALVGVSLVLGSPMPDQLPKSAGKSRPRRQIAFLPFIAVPPVYQIHQIVLVQPEKQCQQGGGLSDRFGEEDGQGSTPAPAAKPAEPSPCVWSIVACCAPGSSKIRYSCFELLGCPGAFWDTNPCEDRVVQAAASTALKFYESNGTSSKP